jgi:hypothetical protein
MIVQVGGQRVSVQVQSSGFARAAAAVREALAAQVAAEAAETGALAAETGAQTAQGLSEDARDAAAADAVATAADRVQTGLDVVATNADVVLTAADAIATAADRVQTGLDASATGADAIATAADRVQTGLDAVATAADRVQTGLDAVATAADRALAPYYASRASLAGETVPAVIKQIATRGYAAEGDGGGANYVRTSYATIVSEGYPAASYQRSTDRFMPDGSTDATNGGYWLVSPGQTLNPFMFGAKCDDPGDGTGTNDAAALNAMVDTAKLLGALAVSLPKGSGHYNASTTGWTIPAEVSVFGYGSPLIVFAGTGFGVKVYNPATVITRFGNWTGFGVLKSSRTWTTGADTTSRAFEAINIRESVIHLTQCDNAHTGFMLTGDDAGSVNNRIYPGIWRNNRIGLTTRRTGAGFANQNIAIGGCIRNDSNTANVLGFEPTLIDRVDNAWQFVGINLEGGIQSPGMVARVDSSYCVFDNCRYELQGDGTFVIEATATGTQVRGGYSNQGPKDAFFDDSGIETQISGLRGMLMHGDLTSGAYQGRARTSNSALVFEAQSTDGVTYAEILGIGTINLYDGAGKGTVANPSVVLNASNSSIDFGDTTGTNAPTAAIRAGNTNLEYLVGKYHRFTRRGIAVVVLDDAVTNIDLATGGYFRSANTGATSISTITGGIDGQEFFIRANDANTSIVFGGSTGFRRSTAKGGAATVLLDNGEVMKFVATATNTAWLV